MNSPERRERGKISRTKCIVMTHYYAQQALLSLLPMHTRGAACENQAGPMWLARSAAEEGEGRAVSSQEEHQA